MTDTTNTEQNRVAAGGRLERLVMCSGSAERCAAIGCPHAKPHAPHKPRQTGWDGKDPCTAIGWCDGMNGKGRNMQCQCVDCT